MAIAPAVTSGSILDPTGLAQRIADIQRQVNQALSAPRTVIQAGSVDGASIIAPGSITTSHIAAGSITTALLQAGAVQAGNIAADAIQATHISAGAITAGDIAANAVTAGTIAAGAIQAGNIAAGAIQTGDLAALSVTTAKLAAGAVDATKINVATLSAISANAGAITAGTIQGATVQTAASGSRVVMDSTGIKGYALDGTTVNFNFNTGTGIATVTGVIIAQGASNIPGSALTGTIALAAIPPIGGGNLVKDSSFEDDSAGATTVNPANWSLYNNGLSPGPTLTRFVTTSAKYGSAVARLTNSTDTIGQMGVVIAPLTIAPRIEATKTYTATAYVLMASGTSNAVVHVHWYDSGGNIIGGGSPSALTAVNASSWTRVQVTAAAPAGAVQAVVYVWIDGPTSGQVGYIDGVQLEEGSVPTAYSPRPDEILPGTVGTTELQALSVTAAKIAVNTITASQIAAGTITATQIAAGGITTSVLAAGAVTAQKLALSFGGQNILRNAAFTYVPTVNTDPGWTSNNVNVVGDTINPGYWQSYENTPTEAPGRRYTVVAGGGPTGGNSWRVTIPSGVTMFAPKGFMSVVQASREPNAWYTQSFYWKGNKQPLVATNGNIINAGFIDNPTTSPTTWQRYSYRFQMTALGGWGNMGNSVSEGFETSLGSFGGFVNTGSQTLTRSSTAPLAGSWSADLVATACNTAWIYSNVGASVVTLAFTGRPVKLRATAKIISASQTVTSLAILARLYDASNTLLGDVNVATQSSPATGTAYTLEGIVDASQFVAGTAKIGIEIIASLGALGNVTFKADSVAILEGDFSDFTYVYPAYDFGTTQSVASDNQLAMVQVEKAEYPSAFSPMADELLPYSVGNTVLGPDSVTTQKILANTILGGDIAATTITGTNIAAGTITAGHISVSTLSALSADLGSVTAGTITGAIMRTAATNPKVQLDTTDGFFLTDAAGVKVLKIKAGSGAIDFLADAGSDVNERMLRWLNGAGTLIGFQQYKELGTNRYRFHQIDDGAGSSMTDTTTVDGGSSDTQRDLTVRGNSGFGTTLRLFNDGTAAGSVAEVDAESETVRILGADGSSDFPKLDTRGNVNCAFGAATISTTGGANGAFISLTLAHGLGVTPLGVTWSIVPGGTFVTGINLCCVSTLNSTNVVFQVQNVSGGAIGSGSVRISYILWY